MVDLGIFKEALWNTLHGGGVLYSIRTTTAGKVVWSGKKE